MIPDLPSHLGRYALLDEIASSHDSAGTAFFRGHDDVLERDVTVRLLVEDDPRAAAFLGAARASALVEDRRLLRVLDILTVPATSTRPAVIAVVSEWARGSTLVEVLRGRERHWLPIDEAVSIVDDVAYAISAGLESNVLHGRLRPSSVIITDAGEVRVRGLAVDAALFGPLTQAPQRDQVDVDSLGALLYLLVTGTWPGDEPVRALPSAQRVNGLFLPPSHVRAEVPVIVDEAVARSLHDAPRPRGQRNIADARAFAAMLAVTRDQVATDSAHAAHADHPLTSDSPIGRILFVLVALVIVGVVGVVGVALVRTDASPRPQPEAAAGDGILTSPALPSLDTEGIERTHSIVSVRSFDPFGDDNRNGKADGRKGRENDDTAGLIIDAASDTGWTSAQYRSADFDGKPGVGVILDLGTSQPVREVTLAFADVGAAVEVRVADRIYRDPGTWNLLARTSAGGTDIAVRGARPIVGRYVLLWFPQAPATTGWGRYQIGLNEVSVLG